MKRLKEVQGNTTNIMISDKLETILRNYTLEKTKDLKNNYLADLIRNVLPEEINHSSNLTLDYIVKGSHGQGNWAEIPWICIFDKEITNIATKGFYPVYLFKSDMSGLYLSLNQGWTQYMEKYGVKIARIKIKENAAILKNKLRTVMNDFSYDDINLQASGDLGKGYELGHVCGVYYSSTNIPNDSVILKDLRNILTVYREAKSLVGKDILNLDYLNDVGNEKDSEPDDIDTIEVNKRFAEIISSTDLEKILKQFEKEISKKQPKLVRKLYKAISRNRKVANLVKQKANYTCELCGKLGFKKKNGERYVEVHHIKELSNSGLDIPSNLICVCANCHRKIHFGSEKELRKLNYEYHSTN